MGGTKSRRKLALTRTQVISRYYYEDPENRRLNQEEGLAFLSLSHVDTLIRQYDENNIEPVYRRTHRFGYEIECDFTGAKLKAGDRLYDVIVLVLPASGFIYAEAIESQKVRPVCNAFTHCFQELGGCPEVIRVDNAKALIISAGSEGGIPQADFETMGDFFGSRIYGCRSGAPTDKGSSEAAVKIVTKQALSHVTLDINERLAQGEDAQLDFINERLKFYINKINDKPLTGHVDSRREVFLRSEKPCLHIPASFDFNLPDSMMGTVPATARVIFNQHQYAVEPKWIGHEFTLHADEKAVRIFIDGAVISTYQRKDKDPSLSTMPNYTPSNHLFMDAFKLPNQYPFVMEWAAHIGSATAKWAELIMQSGSPDPTDIKNVVAVLSLPKSVYKHYKLLDKLIIELQAEVGSDKYLRPDRIIKRWDKLYSHDPIFKSEPGQDLIYSNDNYFSLCNRVMYGEIESLSWLKVENYKRLAEQKRTSHGAMPDKETLRPRADGYAAKYADVKAALKRTTQAHTDANAETGMLEPGADAARSLLPNQSKALQEN
ncbi:MAG: DDE-type integrase/transposase/recombinase [Proteobacteria bacterium]|uniref:DDE-type integrase/transposase/recombinase n=1 Tax=Candidatus Avisuccinivibrio stercorigallinarum TaxID=2840704 RepID=A0A9D9D8X0_9GAMM|nr:DDE-type integrase/transposase/recombinase [Candidatus Avisuccinivibrio stercorigallinarum]